MNAQTWIQWCQKQLADLSLRLFRQGYHPAKIEYLNHTSPDFNQQFQGFLTRLNQVMEEMEANPDGYHHFEDFTKAKMELLTFTNFNRERFLDLNLDLARTA